jgi:phosphoribosyl 1,2-cyclic phosphate phosphodiesterase
VPLIGCSCDVCRSKDPRDQRLRTSLMLEFGDNRVVIDCGPDFRQQMLRAGVDKLDAILLTHEHNDHVSGIDDVRPFNFLQRCDMPVYATAQVGQELRNRFPYAFDLNPYPGAPRLFIHEIAPDRPFYISGVSFIPIEVMHGALPVLGFRIGDFAYITDMKSISESEAEKLIGCHTLVINALHHKPHYSHLNLEEALDFVSHIGPQKAFLTHISHHMGVYDSVELPDGVELAWDGLSFAMTLSKLSNLH